MNALEITNLSKAYKDFSLDNISLSLPTGSIMGLVRKWRRKSTTIKFIMDAVSRDSGKVNVLESTISPPVQ